jgi:hypothetical protein
MSPAANTSAIAATGLMAPYRRFVCDSFRSRNAL